jgi:hypothetical protein
LTVKAGFRKMKKWLKHARIFFPSMLDDTLIISLLVAEVSQLAKAKLQ